MFENLFDAILYDPVGNPRGIRKENIHILNGMAQDKEAECRRFEAAIRQAGGIDIQLLGIGENGHMGFNEPFSPVASRTREVHLTPSTRAANARFFDDDIDRVPPAALSMGIGTILEARKIILIASTYNKAEAIKATVLGDPTERVPASLLQCHPDVTIFLTREAASGLPRVLTFENIPASHTNSAIAGDSTAVTAL